MVSLHSVAILILICFGVSSGQRKLSRNIPVGTDIKVNFDCPEEFGYYPHPTDCTQYYVCVFGGALLESCTGGLMYSHELQTCDWPRNVGCDGLEVSGPPPSSAPSTTTSGRGRERDRDRDEPPRSRYSPPPPPPQPAAVVTSRGQPRQLHQSQQEIIKQQQQQQLYAEAEETLPPAEEIENDRQQRVYRGQPSTVGQVQRDRDGLRHSNAIPSYSGRNEKIGVISFGTQNQHYSGVTDTDDILTNDLTLKRRRKRQVRISRPREETNTWQGARRNNRNTNTRVNSTPRLPSPTQNSNRNNAFRPSNPQNKSSDEFQPITPTNQRQYPTRAPLRTKVTPALQNSQTANQRVTPGPTVINNDYSQSAVTTAVNNKHKETNQEAGQKTTVQLQPAFSQKKAHRQSTNNNVSSSRNSPDRKKSIESSSKRASSTTPSSEDDEDDSEDEENSEESEDEDYDEEREHFPPPPEFYNSASRYDDIVNPFADPNFDFDKFLDRLRGTTTTVKPEPKKVDQSEDYDSRESSNNKESESHKTSSKKSHSKKSDREKSTEESGDENGSENHRNNHEKDRDRDHGRRDHEKELERDNNKDPERDQRIDSKGDRNRDHERDHRGDSDRDHRTDNERNHEEDRRRHQNSGHEEDHGTDRDRNDRTAEPSINNDDPKTTALPNIPLQYQFTTNAAILPINNFQLSTNNNHLKPAVNQFYDTSTLKPALLLTQQSKPILTPFNNFQSRPLLNQYYDRSTILPTLSPILNPYFQQSTIQPTLFLKHQPLPALTDYNNKIAAKPALIFNNPGRPVGNEYYEKAAVTPALFVKQSTSGTNHARNPIENDYYKTAVSPPIINTAGNSNVNGYNNNNNNNNNNNKKPVPLLNYPLANFNVRPIENQYYIKPLPSTSHSETPRQTSNHYYEVSTAKPSPFTSKGKPIVNEYYALATVKPAPVLVNRDAAETEIFKKTTPPEPNTAHNQFYEKKAPVVLSREQTIKLLEISTLKPETVTEQYENSQITPKQYYYSTVRDSQSIDIPSVSDNYPTQLSSTSNRQDNIVERDPPVPDEYYYDDEDGDGDGNGDGDGDGEYEYARNNKDQKKSQVKNFNYEDRQELLKTNRGNDSKLEDVRYSASEESSVAPAQASNPTATATARTLYNSTQYNNNHYDPYYALYDDDVELYRDVDYSHPNNYNNNAQRSQTQSYRGTPAPAVQTTSVREEPQKRGNSVYLQGAYNAQDIYQATGADYSEDNQYDAQVDDQTPYRQPSRQPSSLRGDRNEINDVEEAITKRTTTTTRKPTTTTTRTTTTTTTTTLRTIPPKKSTPPSARTSSRGRGGAHYANTGTQITNNEVTVVNTNRGTPAPRSRPTLKPSTSIVSKAQEYIDIYKYPPRRPDPIYPQPQPDKTAAKCRKDVCLIPDCSCGGKEIPGDLPVEQVPQIVLLTFDDSVNDLNKGLYMDLFEKGRTNPNGCPIAATFYVSHEWTDYSQVQNLYSDGHEIASHTVSHSFGEQFSQKKWTREVAGQREILSAYGGVHLEDVRGMRAPFLSVGGNKMFKMLYDSNFTYDSSMPIYENKPPSWPYTLDYKLFHDCMIPPCPTRSYPGVWEVPMVMWQDLNGGRCSMGDACSNPPDADGVFKMLTKNFQRHYTTNRAPFGLFYHAAWFTQPHHKEGFINFIDSILGMKDVWLLTNWQAIQWVRDPTPVSRLNSFQPFQCDYSNRPRRCNNPKVCNLWHKSGVRYMRTCQPCPEIYPWTGNSGIRSSRIDNDIED